MGKIDFEPIIDQLYAYAEHTLRRKKWFRGKNPDSTVKGRNAEDYVMETVTWIYENEARFNSSLGTLLTFSKTVLNGYLRNDVKSAENKTTLKFNTSNLYLESEFDFFSVEPENSWEEEIVEVKRRIQGNTLLEAILEGNLQRLKKTDICLQYGIASDDYNKARKRLISIIEKVENDFQ